MDPDHLATWIESRIEQQGIKCKKGVGQEIVTQAGGRTEDVVRLARAVFLAALGKGKAKKADVAKALAVAALEDHHRYHRLWNNLARSQQAVLRALAAGETQLYGREARERFGLTSPGTIRNALRALQDAALLADSETMEIDDPYFREWIRLRAMEGGGAVS
jgi:hypothetical protein